MTSKRVVANTIRERVSVSTMCVEGAAHVCGYIGKATSPNWLLVSEQ